MKKNVKRAAILFVILFVLLALVACGRNAAPALSLLKADQSPFSSFRNIPGVTAEEIDAIEKLQQTGGFIYGTTSNSESFLDENGKVSGFTALFCEWMANIFGMEFRPVIYRWGDLQSGLEKGEIDFTGELTPTEYRRKTHFMTGAIAERTIKYFRIQNSSPFEEVARLHPLRYAFLTGTTTWRAVTASFSNLDYETVFIDDSSLVYNMLKNGEIDAFFNEGPGEYIFDAYSDVISYSFVPLIFESVSLATCNEALAPIISVMQKALLSGGRRYLSHLYNRGYLDYQKRKLDMRLTDDERAYLQDNFFIRLAAEYDGYPVSFYNIYENEWQGIAFDVLHEIEQITGLKVDLANGRHTEWPELLEILKSGKAAMITELLRTDDHVGQYVWPKNIIIADNFALLSKSEYPNLNLNDIMNARVALRKDTAYAEMFYRWFPDHAYASEYPSNASAFKALMNDEVDVVMSDRKELLYFSNYNELPGYKVNLVFNRLAETTFGFNAEESTLADIIDKTLALIDVDSIANNWIYKTYDYKAKLLEAQRPWLFGAIGLSLAVLALILILLHRSSNEGKRLEKIVAEKTSFISTILDTTPDLIFRVDLNSHFTEFNASMEKHFNRYKQDVLGKDTTALGVHPDLAAQYMVMDKRVFDEKQPIAFEEIIQSFDGKLPVFETIKTPIIQDGKVTGLVGMARDITLRKNAEKEARKAAEEAKNASEARSRFIANMNHEMRTPMNAIIGLSALVLEEDKPANIKETIKKIHTAGNGLMELINKALDISKVNVGKIELNQVQYDTAGMLNDVITLNRLSVSDKPIVFTLDINEYLPSIMFGDSLRVEQILNNLLSNAFKYTKEGNVTLGVNYFWDGVTGNDTLNSGTMSNGSINNVWLSFYIRDTGIGIHEGDVAKLFADNNQFDNKINRENDGSGFGLIVTKRIIELMDGEISVESEFGKGSTFRFRIRQGFVTNTPIGRETAENLRSFRYGEKQKQDKAKLMRPDLSYARALVVDDFPVNLDVAAGMLRKYKITVDCISNGRDAVDRIAAGEPMYNAIFMDHMMPGMDGMAATAAIRALNIEYAKNIPIIALTANAAVGNEQMFLNNGFNAFLAKPFNATGLDSVVQRWVMTNEQTVGESKKENEDAKR
jgi:PAS domain S-box-containing protein